MFDWASGAQPERGTENLETFVKPWLAPMEALCLHGLVWRGEAPLLLANVTAVLPVSRVFHCTTCVVVPKLQGLS